MSTGCKIEGCGRILTAHGLCEAHYFRLRKHGDPRAHIPIAPPRGERGRCTMDNCAKPHFAHGLCSAHYTRRRRGDVDLQAPSVKQRVANINVDELVRLYVVEHRSTVRLAKHFGVADVTISALLKKTGVSIRGAKAPRFHIRGINNPNWKADRKQLKLTKSQSRPAFEISTWRTTVMTRDRFECQSCSASEYLEAHHIESWSTCIEKRFDPSNGITFCKTCHVEFHKWFGRRNNNRTQLAQFIAPAMEIAA